MSVRLAEIRIQHRNQRTASAMEDGRQVGSQRGAAGPAEALKRPAALRPLPRKLWSRVPGG